MTVFCPKGCLVCFRFGLVFFPLLICVEENTHFSFQGFICYEVVFHAEKFNGFGHYHGNVTRQAQELSWILFSFSFL